MKICEYDNVRCPYCGEEEHLGEVGPVAFPQRPPERGPAIQPAHFVSCKSCGGDFVITCED